jgi:LuxR family maltose regulon positive regulatory protein
LHLSASQWYQQAKANLDAIQARLAADEGKQIPEVQGHMTAMRAYLARLDGDLATAVTLSRKALANLSEQDALLRARIIFDLATAHYLLGEFEPASQLLTNNITTGQTAQHLMSTLSYIYLQAQILRAQGALGQALQLCQEGLDLVTRGGWGDFPAAGYLYVAIGDLLRERSDLPAAAQYLEKGVELGKAGGDPHILIIGYVWLAWLRQTKGEVNGSQKAIRAALHLVQQH